MNRFYEQALETLENNDCKHGDVIDAYNKRVIGGGKSDHHDTTRGIQDSNISCCRGKVRVVADLGVGGERGRVLDTAGISTSITATEYKDPLKVIVEN